MNRKQEKAMFARKNELFHKIEKTRPDLGISKDSKQYKDWIKLVNEKKELEKKIQGEPTWKTQKVKCTDCGNTNEIRVLGHQNPKTYVCAGCTDHNYNKNLQEGYCDKCGEWWNHTADCPTRKED